MTTENIGSIAYDLKLDTSEFDKGTQNATKTIGEFGKKAAVGFAAAGVGLTLFAKNATDFTMNFAKESRALGREIGVSTTEASRLTAALGRMGIESQSASQMFGIFSKQIVASTENTETNRIAVDKLKLKIEATQRAIAEIVAEIKKHGDKSGDLNLKLRVLNNTLREQQEEMKQSTDSFAKLGVSTKDASGRQKDFVSILLEVSDKFKAMPNGIEKTALAMELFGRAGKDMLPILNLGSDGITRLEKEADKLGLTLGTDTISKINELSIANKDLKQKQDALSIAIGIATIPAITALKDAQNNLLQSLLNTDGPLRTLTIGFLSFGGPVFGATSAVITFIGACVQAKPAIDAMIASTKLMTMLSIAGWAALVVADLYLIVKATQAVTKAFEEINNAKIAKSNLEYSQTVNRNELNKLLKDGTPEQKARAQKVLNSSLMKNARGTAYSPGGLSLVGERGPELVNLPRGAEVFTNQRTKGMLGSSNNITVNVGTVRSNSDENYIFRRLDRQFERSAMGISI